MKKGKTNNPNGRPKGSPNRTTAQMKDLINRFLSDNLENLQRDFDKLEPKDKLYFIEKIMKYVLPQQQSYTENIDVSQLSESEIDSLLDRIMRKEGD